LLVCLWRVFLAVRIRWLRAMSSVVTDSMGGVRPMRRNLPRAVLLVAGSLVVAKPRSALVRRGGAGSGSCLWRPGTGPGGSRRRRQR
jgi:hypothetical protein